MARPASLRPIAPARCALGPPGCLPPRTSPLSRPSGSSGGGARRWRPSGSVKSSARHLLCLVRALWHAEAMRDPAILAFNHRPARAAQRQARPRCRHARASSLASGHDLRAPTLLRHLLRGRATRRLDQSHVDRQGQLARAAAFPPRSLAAAPAMLACRHCPIRLQGLRGKEPAAGAVPVATAPSPGPARCEPHSGTGHAMAHRRGT